MPINMPRKQHQKSGPRRVEGQKTVPTRTEARVERIIQVAQWSKPDDARRLIAAELTAHVVERRHRPIHHRDPALRPLTEMERILRFELEGPVRVPRVGDKIRRCFRTGGRQAFACISPWVLTVIEVYSSCEVGVRGPFGGIDRIRSWIRVS